MQLNLTGEGRQRKLRIAIGNKTMLLDGLGIDSFVEQLALFRASMLPRVPDAMIPTHDYPITVDPCWYIEPSLLMEAMTIFFRHEGLGWTGFALTDAECEAWIGELRAVARGIEASASVEMRQ
ncbi:hypothetical protein [Paraburkholderia tagetis]|uniref:Uncharacterized protein n=1 Tax=Paraburkholderia tagetis TaxID=2913261 RepID=A0A9X1UFE0_9BURK|nr:hypothetical protein [Paraburkholderia tagetis]MCG5071843.1 hypothetical protein [Paraburkholderia tagetis]